MFKTPVRGQLNKVGGEWNHWPRIYRQAFFFLLDAIVIIFSLYIAFWLRFDGSIPAHYLNMLRFLIPAALVIKFPVFFIFKAYQFSLSYVGLEELLNLVLACGVGSLVLSSLPFFLRDWPFLSGLPRSVLVIDFAFTVLGTVGIRLSKRILKHIFSRGNAQQDKKRAFIIGAGEAGEQLVRNLKRDEKADLWPVGFFDDDSGKWGLLIHGVPVLGQRSRLPEFMKLKGVDAIIIAMPSSPSWVIRDTVELARRGGAKEIKVIPFLSELYTGEVKVSDIRELQPEDILPREPVSVDLKFVEDFLKGKKVLVTGAAGSIGSELCRQILRFSPTQLLVVDFDETGLFNLEMNLKKLFPRGEIKVFVADIRDRARISSIFHREQPQVVFHAAAYKHVPLMESNPEEAVKTNVFGTQVMIEEACRGGAEAFVLISTDKAVNPVSVMGLTKRVAETVVLAMREGISTRCMAVRFGNVLGSRGSVIPIFLEQIHHGGPVTVTHPEMERYFMTISEAVLLVLQAAAMGKGGEVFVLDMGKPVKILDIARELIRFHGLEPDKDIPIVFTGIRPGEKLREEILTAEEGTEATKQKQIYVAKNSKRFSSHDLENKLDELAKVIGEGAENDLIKGILREIIYDLGSPVSGR